MNVFSLSSMRASPRLFTMVSPPLLSMAVCVAPVPFPPAHTCFCSFFSLLCSRSLSAGSHIVLHSQPLPGGLWLGSGVTTAERAATTRPAPLCHSAARYPVQHESRSQGSRRNSTRALTATGNRQPTAPHTGCHHATCPRGDKPLCANGPINSLSPYAGTIDVHFAKQRTGNNACQP